MSGGVEAAFKWKARMDKERTDLKKLEEMQNHKRKARINKARTDLEELEEKQTYWSPLTETEYKRLQECRSILKDV